MKVSDFHDHESHMYYLLIILFKALNNLGITQLFVILLKILGI